MEHCTWYSNVVGSISSMMGQTTLVGELAIRSNNGTNQPMVQ